MRLVKLSDNYVFKSFDCGVKDLNDFLIEDAKDYAHRLMSVTYIIENDDDIVAYFSVSNDRISIPDADKATWRKIKKLFPHSKHRADYPAVKIGRLAVNTKYKGQHIGADILHFVKQHFIQNNRTGCAFITVDARRDAIDFYRKNGFTILDKSIAEDESAETCPLYFNLYSFMIS